MKFIWGLMAVILVCCLVLPASIAYAEVPISVSIVAASAAEDGLGSPFQHHSFIDDGTNWVLYQSGGMVLSTYSDDGTTWVAGDIVAYCNATTAETVGGQFDTWWDAGDGTLHVIVVNTSVNNSDINYAAFDVDSVAHTLTIDGAWVAAVEGVANISYRNPTICISNNESPFITYGAVNNSVSDVYLVTTNDSSDDPWVPEVNFPMFNFSANASRPAMYGSVIPLWTSNDNVSVQYAGYNGSEYKIYQTNINWNGSEWVDETGISGIDSSDWYLPTGFEWNYNAVSIDTTINNDDVAIQCVQTDGAEYRVFFNRRGNESDIWASTYARNFGAGGWGSLYVGAMGIRNNTYGIVYSGWDMTALSEDVWSADFEPVTGDWTTITSVYTDVNVPAVSTMSDYMYDIDDTYDMGFIYGTTTDDNIMYGRYGPPVIPTVVTDFVNATGMIVSLLISFLLIVMLLGIAFKEGMNNGWNEGTKLAITAIIGIIVIETIIIAFF